MQRIKDHLKQVMGYEPRSCHVCFDLLVSCRVGEADRDEAAFAPKSLAAR